MLEEKWNILQADLDEKRRFLNYLCDKEYSLLSEDEKDLIDALIDDIAYEEDMANQIGYSMEYFYDLRRN